MRPSTGLVLSVLILAAAACGDDSTSPDGGAADAAMPPDSGMPADGGGPVDTGGPDTGGRDAGADAGLECFGLSLDPDVPLAIDGTFDTSGPFWRRPYDDPEVCPATMLLPETAAEVPFVAYAFCNEDTVAHTFTFEMLSQDGPAGETPLDDPYLILYQGVGIPADPLMCLAVNDDIPDSIGVSDSEITGISVPPGGAITMVGTTFTYDGADGTGTGYYVLVVTVAD